MTGLLSGSRICGNARRVCVGIVVLSSLNALCSTISATGSQSRYYLSHVARGVTVEVSELILSRLRSVIHLEP